MLVSNAAVHAQSAEVSVTSSARMPVSSPSKQLTAAEEARGLYIYPLTGLVTGDPLTRISGALDDRGEWITPNPKLEGLIADRAKDWVASLEHAPVAGIQRDPMGVLYVAAGHDAVARQQFDARLATPGLSLEDQAYTLFLAVSAFAIKASDTARMQSSLNYLHKLNALPRRIAAYQQFAAHAKLADVYHSGGDGAAVVAQLTQAFPLVADIPFGYRRFDLNSTIGLAFITLADVLSGQPKGRAQIDSIGRWVAPFTVTPAELLAHDTPDSVAFKLGVTNTADWNAVLQMSSHLGQVAPEVVANFWWNIAPPTETSTAAAGARVKRLDDGIIRVIEYGHYGCAGCLASLPKLDRLRKEAPAGVEMWYVSDGNGGTWGNTPCTTEEEAEHLRRYYLDRKKYGMPIALFVGDRAADLDGGSVQTGSPTFAAYPIMGFPWFVITDGKGVVRHASFGFNEALISHTVKFLLAEKAGSVSAGGTIPARP